jgi:tetratricopeptide (TPR) repeat protein
MNHAHPAMAPPPPAAGPAPAALTQALPAVGLILATLLAYQPAWRGGMLWDDNGHVTQPALQALDGLRKIWFQPGATQQYYPVVFSAFWLEHRLWADATLGYHLVNIFLHGLAAFLLFRLLRRLALPGSLLAGALFALHPVAVESVAWISEQKNTLSTVFCLSAALVYLDFDLRRGKTRYALALLLFALGLGSKTVVATLPVSLLVLLWWRRGSWAWWRDVAPLVPFALLGAAVGLFTARVEHDTIGAFGPAFAWTILERGLIAGRAWWFYLGKLLWPVDLTFIYPRWQVSGAVWWQYLYPAAALGLGAGLWLLRRRWRVARAALAALLIFTVTLLPALGFVNVYPFLYSFVADHFQYLACLPVIALAAAGIATGLQRLRLWRRPAGYVLCLALLATLATLTWRQSRTYRDAPTLYQAILDRNPDCWMAQLNLGAILADTGKPDLAIPHLRQALTAQLDPLITLRIHNDLALALYKADRLAEAAEEYRTVLRLRSDYPDARDHLADALAQLARYPEAIEQYQQVLASKPNNAIIHANLGNALAGAGRLADAIDQYREALRLAPGYAPAHYQLAGTLLTCGHPQDAIAEYERALTAGPTLIPACVNLAQVLATHQPAPGTDPMREIRLAQGLCATAGPDIPYPPMLLAAAYAYAGRYSDAVATAETALHIAQAHGPEPLIPILASQLQIYRAKAQAQAATTPASSPTATGSQPASPAP